MLLQKAIFLEDILEKGEDPGEAAKRVAEVEKAKKAQEAAAAKSQREREERERAALAQAEAEVKKAGSNSGKLKHTFLIPLSKAKSVYRRRCRVLLRRVRTLTPARITHTIRRLPPNSRTKLPSCVLNLQGRGLQVSAGWVASPGGRKTQTGIRSSAQRVSSSRPAASIRLWYTSLSIFVTSIRLQAVILLWLYDLRL